METTRVVVDASDPRKDRFIDKDQALELCKIGDLKWDSSSGAYTGNVRKWNVHLDGKIIGTVYGVTIHGALRLAQTMYGEPGLMVTAQI